MTQSSVIQGDSEGLKTVSEFSFVCLKGKKIGIKFYILRQIAMREKFNFVPAFFVKCKQETFDPAQIPQMLQETKQQIREKSCDPRVQESASEWIFHARFSISLLVVFFFFFALSHLLFFFFSRAFFNLRRWYSYQNSTHGRRHCQTARFPFAHLPKYTLFAP